MTSYWFFQIESLIGLWKTSLLICLCKTIGNRAYCSLHTWWRTGWLFTGMINPWHHEHQMDIFILKIMNWLHQILLYKRPPLSKCIGLYFSCNFYWLINERPQEGLPHKRTVTHWLVTWAVITRPVITSCGRRCLSMIASLQALNQRRPRWSPASRPLFPAGDNTSRPVCGDSELWLYTADCQQRHRHFPQLKG